MRKPVKKINLPDGVLVSDTKWPTTPGQRCHDVGENGVLEFYRVSDRSGKAYWVITTLVISRAQSLRTGTDRKYGIRIDDGAIVRVGKGPHVTDVVTIYVTKARLPKLQRFVDLYTKGLAEAGIIRDRIGSRRAQGQLERAAGNRSWLWNN